MIGARMADKLIDSINSMGQQFAETLADAFDVDSSRDERDRFFLKLAIRIRMQPGGRAEEYLNHFLSGDGSPKYFDIGDLIATDKGVANRLQSEVVRRVLKIKTVRELREDNRMSLTPEAAQDRNVITIFQKNYENTDWQLCLGTFPFTWDIIGMSDGKESIIVSIGGKNKYKWHPNDKRITRFLHEAGYRLAASGDARNFDMVAKPLVYKVSTVNREILRLATFTQTNPNHRGLIGDETSETISQVSRAFDEIQDRSTKILTEAYKDLTDMYEKMTRYR